MNVPGTDTCQLDVAPGILTSQHQCRGCVCCLKLSPNLRKALKPSAEDKQKADILEVRWVFMPRTAFCMFAVSLFMQLGECALALSPLCSCPQVAKLDKVIAVALKGDMSAEA